MSDEGSGASVTLSAGGNETADTTIGIDVSKYQGTIDWAEVASSGVDFAMIKSATERRRQGLSMLTPMQNTTCSRLQPTELKSVYTSSHQQLMNLKLLKNRLGC